MDREVSRTLAELEHKLHELERALASAGQRGADRTPSDGGARPVAGPVTAGEPAASRQYGGARIVDEDEPVSPRNPSATRPAEQDPIAAEEAHPYARQAPALASPPQSEPPQTFGESIELAELVRFRDRLDRTLRELAEEYERIICLRNPSSPFPPPREP